MPRRDDRPARYGIRALGRIDFRLQFHIDWRDPRVRQVFALMLPVTIGLGIVNLDQLINSAFGSLVSRGSAARDRKRLSHLHAPAGRLQRAGRHRALPDTQPHGGATRCAGMRRAIGVGMRQINLLLIPAATFIARARDPDRAADLRTRRIHRTLDPSRVDRALLVRLQPAVRRASTCCSHGRSLPCSGRGSRRASRRSTSSST